MKISISDVTSRTITTDGKIMCLSNPKKETIDGVNKLVWGVDIDSGDRILNPDFMVDVKNQFSI